MTASPWSAQGVGCWESGQEAIATPMFTPATRQISLAQVMEACRLRPMTLTISLTRAGHPVLAASAEIRYGVSRRQTWGRTCSFARIG